MRHIDNSENSLKVKKDKERRTSLAELIPDWPVLSKRKTAIKVILMSLIKIRILLFSLTDFTTNTNTFVYFLVFKNV